MVGVVTQSTKLTRIVSTAAPKLARHRGIEVVADLLEFWPRRYLEHTADLGTLHVGMYVVAGATDKTATTRSMKNRRGEMLTVTITDGTHEVDLVFFKAWGHKDALVPGTTALFAGTVGMYRGRWAGGWGCCGSC